MMTPRHTMRWLLTGVLLLGGVPAISAEEPLPAAIKGDLGYLEQLYRYLHAHPELSYQEEQTAARIASELQGLGFDVTTGVGGHGLVGVLKNGDGPTVLLRTDLDALPVKEQTGLPYSSTVKAVEQTGQDVSVMHACGHDMHMTVFVGAARRLAAMTDQWSGTLVMIGQPAEERGAGAKAMLDDGLFERFPRPDYNVALHVSASLDAGRIAWVEGFALANVDSVDITVHGVGGHGAYPQATKDPIVLASRIVTALQTISSREIDPQEPVVVTVGSIHGGAKHNIIGNRVDLQLTVRSYADATRKKALDAIRRIAVNEGRVAGLPEELLPEVFIQEQEYTPATYNDPALTERLVKALSDQMGADRLVRTKPVMGGEDFSRYGREGIPSVMFWLGAVPPDKFAAAQKGDLNLPSLHSPEFAPLPEPTIRTGVEAMTRAAMDLLGK